eukprot:5528821-Amphidinium_carterae.1
MTSATAVVRSETSLKKRTGEPLNDGHRTLDYFARLTRPWTALVQVPFCSAFQAVPFLTCKRADRSLWASVLCC